MRGEARRICGQYIPEEIYSTKRDEIAVELLADLEKETVKFVDNYDSTRQEPTVLPGKFPNLICNGSTGIAVGMATNIPPHNLVEVARAVTMVIDNTDCANVDLMELGRSWAAENVPYRFSIPPPIG